MDVHSDNGLAKIDYNINERHSLNGELFMNSFGGLATQNQVHDYWRTATENQSRLGGVHSTGLPGPTIVNRAKFGVNRVHQVSTSSDCPAIGQPGSRSLHTAPPPC